MTAFRNGALTLSDLCPRYEDVTGEPVHVGLDGEHYDAQVRGEV